MDDVQGCTSVTVDMESIVTTLMPRVQGHTGTACLIVFVLILNILST